MENKPEKIEIEGEILEVLPNTLFKVKIISSPIGELIDREILCHLSGKLRKNFIKIMQGDKVKAEMTPKYDLNLGRITYRIK